MISWKMYTIMLLKLPHRLPDLQSSLTLTMCSTLNLDWSNTLKDILFFAVSDAITDISASMAPSTSHFVQGPILALLRPDILCCKNTIGFVLLPFSTFLDYRIKASSILQKKYSKSKTLGFSYNLCLFNNLRNQTISLWG